MRILVYGSGAVGGYLGGKLARGGHAVTLVARSVSAAAINQDGLQITEADTTFRVWPTAVSSIARAFMGDETGYDLIIMGMKAYDLEPAIDPLVAFCPNPAAIITTQNGIGVEDPLMRQFGAEGITASSLTVPITKEATNHLLVEKEGRGLALAATYPGQPIRKWVKMFRNADVTAEAVDDYRSMKWSKAVLNILGNAICAILNRSPEAVYKSPTGFDLEVRMVQEALDVMDALNLDVLDLPGAPTKRLVFGIRRAPRFLLQPILTQLVARQGRGDKMPSFHLDLSSGKGKNEVVFHNGAIAQAGKAQGVPTPVNAALTDVLMQLARDDVDWREYDGNAKRLMAVVKQYEKKMR